MRRLRTLARGPGPGALGEGGLPVAGPAAVACLHPQGPVCGDFRGHRLAPPSARFAGFEAVQVAAAGSQCGPGPLGQGAAHLRPRRSGQPSSALGTVRWIIGGT